MSITAQSQKATQTAMFIVMLIPCNIFAKHIFREVSRPEQSLYHVNY